jgi:hypothetical protein
MAAAAAGAADLVVACAHSKARHPICSGSQTLPTLVGTCTPGGGAVS